MDTTEYQNFLRNPDTFLNDANNVSQVRLNGSMSSVIANSTSRTVTHPGCVPLHYQYSAARVVPVTLKHDQTGIPATSALWFSRQDQTGTFQKDRCYYLQWGSDNAYAIELGTDAQLFITAELTGCGILIFSAPNKVIVVHHNIQVAPVQQNKLQKIFESNTAFNRRDTANREKERDCALHNLAYHIIDSTPEITGGNQISVKDYGDKARVFGVRRGGWRIYLNRQGTNDYVTEKVFG